MFGSFLRALWLVCASKVYSGLGADIVYGIITLIIPRPMSVNACLQQLAGTTSDLGVKCFGATTIGDQTTEKQGVLVFCAWDSLRHRGSHCLELSHDPQQC